MKKTILISLGIFIAIFVTVVIVYFVRKPASITTLPTPKPTSVAVASPVTAPVMVVEPASVCSKNIVVACVSPSPSPSASASVSPSPSTSAIVSPSPSASPSTPPAAALDCVAKRAYEDDSRNRAAFYYMEKEIANASTIVSGQTILYNVTAKNTGGNSAPDVTITDKLSSNLTYLDGDTGCTYDSATRVVTCTVGTLAASSEAQRSFRATVSAASNTSIANTAEVSSTNGQRDSCSITMDSTGKVIVVVPSPVPTELPQAGVFEVTVGTVGIGMLLLIAGALGLLLL